MNMMKHERRAGHLKKVQVLVRAGYCPVAETVVYTTVTGVPLSATRGRAQSGICNPAAGRVPPRQDIIKNLRIAAHRDGKTLLFIDYSIKHFVSHFFSGSLVLNLQIQRTLRNQSESLNM